VETHREVIDVAKQQDSVPVVAADNARLRFHRKDRPMRLAFLLVILVMLVVNWGCNKREPATTSTTTATPTPPKTQQTATPATQALDQPVIEYWDGGIYLAGIKPSLLFAAWPDGKVARKVSDMTYVGHVSPEVIAKLMTDIESAGIDKPPLTYCGVVVDGPEQILSVVHSGHVIHLRYGGKTDFRDLGPYASPSRSDCEAFVRMWQQIMQVIDAVKPADTKEAETKDAQHNFGLIFPRS
jgi:hypothetical protein